MVNNTNVNSFTYQQYTLNRNYIEIIKKENITTWYKNKLIHRDDGPDIEYLNGSKEYWVNGNLHRENGPAIITDRYMAWYRNGQLHRENGPAVEFGFKYKQWFINGKSHRIDGPALEYFDGYKERYINGELYTLDCLNFKVNVIKKFFKMVKTVNLMKRILFVKKLQSNFVTDISYVIALHI